MHTRLKGLVFDLTERGKNAGVTRGNGAQAAYKSEQNAKYQKNGGQHSAHDRLVDLFGAEDSDQCGNKNQNGEYE
jgi:hypothetical protein